MKGVARALKGMNLPPGVLQNLAAGGAPAPDPRAEFNAVLLATVSHVNKKPNFNFELELNDLWTRLGVLKQEQAADAPLGLARMFGAFKDLDGQLGPLMTQLLKSQQAVGR